MASAADRNMQHIRALVELGPTTETDGQLLGRWADHRDGRLIFKKLGAYVTIFLALGSVTLGAGFALVPTTPTQLAKKQRLAAPEALARKEASFADAFGSDNGPRVDPNGDPLPPGAVRRIGSNRFRHIGVVSRVAYTPDGKSLASTSYESDSDARDGCLSFWDAATGKLRWRLPIAQLGFEPALAVSGDGKKIAVVTHAFGMLVSDTGKELTRQKWPSGEDEYSVYCAAIATDFGTFACGYSDGTVRLYDAVTGKEKVRRVVGDKAQKQHPLALEFSADGTRIYVLANKRPGVVAFDTNSGELAQTLEFPKAEVPNGTYPFRLFLRNHLLAAIGKDGMVLWDLTTGKQRHRIEKNMTALRWGAFSPDAGIFAVGRTAKDIVLFDTATGIERQRLPAHETWGSLVFAPDGKTLAVADHGGCVDLWDLATGKLAATSPEPNGGFRVRFANNGKQLLFMGHSVAWWDVSSAQAVRRLPRDPDFYAPSVSPDGKVMAASLLNKSDLALIDTATGAQLWAMTGHTSFGARTVFSPDGTKLFSAGLEDPRVIIWDVATGKPTHELQSHTGWVDTLAVSPNGRWLASQAAASNANGDFDIRLWEVATGKLLKRMRPKGSLVHAMVFTPDSSTLVSAGEKLSPFNHDTEIELWDVATGKELRAETGPKYGFWGLAISPDGRMLAIGGKDLQLWEMATGKTRARIAGHEGIVYSTDFSPDGRLLAAASSDAPVYLWDVYETIKPKLTGEKLSNEDRARLWRRLADTDASQAFAAICELIAHPSEAAALLEDEWKRMPRADAKQMHKWVEDLGSDQFAMRQTATAELEKFAAEYEGLLREAFKRPSSLEARQRLEKILSHIDPRRLLRRGRMLEVLEQLRTAPARQFLRTLAEQTEDSAMAREATAGLKRLVGGK